MHYIGLVTVPWPFSDYSPSAETPTTTTTPPIPEISGSPIENLLWWLGSCLFAGISMYPISNLAAIICLLLHFGYQVRKSLEDDELEAKLCNGVCRTCDANKTQDSCLGGCRLKVNHWGMCDCQVAQLAKALHRDGVLDPSSDEDFELVEEPSGDPSASS